MSALPKFCFQSPKVVETQNHTVQRFTGDPHDVLDQLRFEKRTGMLLIHISQGSIFKTQFDTRTKETNPETVK